MTKYYCDICGQELKVITRLTLPNLWSGEIVDGSEPYDLCRSCSRHIYTIIEDYKKIMKGEKNEGVS